MWYIYIRKFGSVNVYHIVMILVLRLSTHLFSFILLYKKSVKQLSKPNLSSVCNRYCTVEIDSGNFYISNVHFCK